MRLFLLSILLLLSGCVEIIEHPDPKRHAKRQMQKVIEKVDALYQRFDRVEESEEDNYTLTSQDAVPGYGEITTQSAGRLIRYLNLSEKDVFYDLGSGTGKLAVQVLLGSKAKRVVGLELVKSRFYVSNYMLKQLRVTNMIPPKQDLEFWMVNYLTYDFSEATVVYISLTHFPKLFLKRLTRKLEKTLKPGTKVVSLHPLAVSDYFYFLGQKNYMMTWSKTYEGTPVYFYQVKNG